MLTEIVYDLDEFLSLLSRSGIRRIHHEIYWKVLEKDLGIPTKVEAGITFYGISREGHVLKCELSRIARWNDDELDKYAGDSVIDRFNKWIQEQWKEFEKKAKEIGSTPGRFEAVAILPALHERN